MRDPNHRKGSSPGRIIPIKIDRDSSPEGRPHLYSYGTIPRIPYGICKRL